MLLKNPKEFAHVAREWAVKYAAAPQKDESGGSDALKAEAREAQKAKEAGGAASKPSQ